MNEKRKPLFVSSLVKKLWRKNLPLLSKPRFSGQQNVGNFLEETLACWRGVLLLLPAPAAGLSH